MYEDSQFYFAENAVTGQQGACNCERRCYDGSVGSGVARLRSSVFLLTQAAPHPKGVEGPQCWMFVLTL